MNFDLAGLLGSATPDGALSSHVEEIQAQHKKIWNDLSDRPTKVELETASGRVTLLQQEWLSSEIKGRAGVDRPVDLNPLVPEQATIKVIWDDLARSSLQIANMSAGETLQRRIIADQKLGIADVLAGNGKDGGPSSLDKLITWTIIVLALYVAYRLFGK